MGALFQMIVNVVSGSYQLWAGLIKSVRSLACTMGLLVAVAE